MPLVKKKRCRKCGKWTTDFAADYMAECKKCRDVVSETTRVRRQIKAKAIEHKGGGCQRCGYNACQRNLTFHHIDPTTKDPRLIRKGKRASKKRGQKQSCVTQTVSVVALSRKWKVVKEEIDKCILLCKNCHGEIEEGLWSIGEILTDTEFQQCVVDETVKDLLNGSRR